MDVCIMFSEKVWLSRANKLCKLVCNFLPLILHVGKPVMAEHGMLEHQMWSTKIWNCDSKPNCRTVMPEMVNYGTPNLQQ